MLFVRSKNQVDNVSGGLGRPCASIRRNLTAGFLGIALTLSACTSPEQARKQREHQLGEFSKQVVLHILDRNPDTYRGSVSHLMREELDDNTINNLQEIGQLPEPGLDELKFVDQAQTNKTSNRVEVLHTKPVAEITKAVVPFKVSGKVVDLVANKPKDTKPFDLEVDCKLTDEMEGYPRVVAVRGLPDLKHPGKQKRDFRKRYKQA